jgi:hypothetical protein
MKLIAPRKQKKTKPHDYGLQSVALLVRALIAQRVARKAYKGYKWTRRLPFIAAGAAGAAVIAFVVRKVMQKSGGAPDAGATPSATPASTTVPVSTPSTPTPTGAPTAVTPAPTAAADGAPEPGQGDAGETKT